MSDADHLDEQAILDWLSGDLADERRGAMLDHVDGCDPCRELIAAALRSTAGPAPPPTPSAAAPDGPAAAGAILADRFELLEPLGSGAMGVVWRARDRTVDQDVALKLLPADRARDAGYLARFRDELLLARAISHPNVCRLHDLVQADGRWFLTMELIEGVPLSVIAAGDPLPADRVQRLLAQVAAGLAAAHEAGVVHRDLKPSNVVVTPDERAVVLDFGIARRDGEDGRTLAGVVVGTPRYMAPEQGETSRVDARADVYALGLLGCELLAGRVPLDRGDLVPTLVARRQEDPPPVRTLAPGAPARLSWILDACLRRDPDARPPNGGAVLALLEGRAEIAGPAATVSRRGLLITLTAVAVALAALALWRGGPVEAPPPVVLGAFEVADPADAWLTDALPGYVAEELRDGWGAESSRADADPSALAGRAERSGPGLAVTAQVRLGDREAELTGATPRALGAAIAAWLVQTHPRSTLLPTDEDLDAADCDDAETWRRHRRARRATALGEWDRAAALARDSCGDDPTTLQPRPDGDGLEQVAYAEALFARGDVDGGIARLEALGRAGPERSVALRALTAWQAGYLDGWLARAPAPERALLHAREAVAAAPHDPGALALRALARALAGDHPGAREDATAALRWSEQPPESAILALVTSAAMEDRWDDAAAAGRRLLEVEGSERDAEALALLGGIDLARGAFERGQERVGEAAERYGQRGEAALAADTWLFQSWTYELLGDRPAATDALDRTVAADPSFGEFGGEVELAYRAIRRREAVARGEPAPPLLAWYRERLQEMDPDPADRAALRHYELYAAWQDADRSAVRALHREITLGPYVETWVAFPAAEAAEQAGDFGAAEALYRALVEDPYSWEEPILVARARLGLGRVLAALDRPDESRAALRAFVAAWDLAPTDAPELQEARRLLASLGEQPSP